MEEPPPGLNDLPASLVAQVALHTDRRADGLALLRVSKHIHTALQAEAPWLWEAPVIKGNSPGLVASGQRGFLAGYRRHAAAFRALALSSGASSENLTAQLPALLRTVADARSPLLRHLHLHINFSPTTIGRYSPTCQAIASLTALTALILDFPRCYQRQALPLEPLGQLSTLTSLEILEITVPNVEPSPGGDVCLLPGDLLPALTRLTRLGLSKTAYDTHLLAGTWWRYDAGAGAEPNGAGASGAGPRGPALKELHLTNFEMVLPPEDGLMAGGPAGRAALVLAACASLERLSLSCAWPLDLYTVAPMLSRLTRLDVCRPAEGGAQQINTLLGAVGWCQGLVDLRLGLDGWPLPPALGTFSHLTRLVAHVPQLPASWAAACPALRVLHLPSLESELPDGLSLELEELRVEGPRLASVCRAASQLTNLTCLKCIWRDEGKQELLPGPYLAGLQELVVGKKPYFCTEPAWQLTAWTALWQASSLEVLNLALCKDIGREPGPLKQAVLRLPALRRLVLPLGRSEAALEAVRRRLPGVEVQ